MGNQTTLALQHQLETMGLSGGLIVPTRKGNKYALAARVSGSVYRAFATAKAIRWTINVVESRHGLPVLSIVAHTASTQVRVLANMVDQNVRTMLENLQNNDGFLLALMFQSTEEHIGLISHGIQEELPRLLTLSQCHPTLSRADAIADLTELGTLFLEKSTVPCPEGMALENIAVITIFEG